MADGVVLLGDRPIIPRSLRTEVLATLHAGHQGTTSMISRATTAVWWPGVNDDIARLRARCKQCMSNAPSQPKSPPVSPPSPAYPFQEICADYFSVKGKNYLVVVDRYSGWPSVYLARTSTAKELMTMVQGHCETFGAPETLTTDGRSQFVAREMSQFLET